MRRFSVKGMSCAACVARVEKAVSAVPGVESCTVNLLTNSMGIEGTASDEAVIFAIRRAGYDGAPETSAPGAASKAGQEAVSSSMEKDGSASRLAISAVLLVVLLYFSMGYMLWNVPVPEFLGRNCLSMGILQLLLASAVLVVNGRFFASGFNAVRHGSPNMDTLVAMGTGVSYLYSLWGLFAMSDAMLSGGHDAAMPYMNELYFDSAAAILTLISVGKMLESKAKGRTTDALKSLMRLSVDEAVVERDGREMSVPVSEVRVGDIFVVRPGSGIPVDGKVIAGEGAVDESALTGESIPVDKSEGDTVSATTVNLSGFLRCEAVKVGEDTTFSRIVRLVEDAAATKAPIARMADKVSAIFVPAVIGLAVLVVIGWLVAGADPGTALSHGVAVLVISCPCALGLATPVAIMVGNGLGARNGILFKSSASLENTGRVGIVALDKTGTITSGKPVVTGIYPSEGMSEELLLSLACSVETMSEHPLARAIVNCSEDRGISAAEVSGFRSFAGGGVEASSGGKVIAGGNARFISSRCTLDAEAMQLADSLAEEGATPVFFSYGGRLAGVMAVADVLRPDAPDAVAELHRMGLRVVMLTGDNARTAAAIGARAGIDEVMAGLLPDGKSAAIRELASSGKVAMVGDGVNDAPALASSDVGIAIGAGTDVAVDSADVVLMKSSLADVPAAIRLGRATLVNIRENLFWAFIYNAVGIPLAAGLFEGIAGWSLNPVFCAAAMGLSSFCVVGNALRLNLLNIYKHKTEKNMTRTLNVSGMMCPHCEMSVRKALEAIDGVKDAVVSHKAGTAVVILDKEVPDETLRTAVESQGYKVSGME